MDFRRAPMDPGEAARRFGDRLEESGLPHFVSAEHDFELDLLKVSWAHRVTLYMDLTREGFLDPIDGYGRAVILGLRHCCEECAKLDGHVPPRTASPIPGVEVYDCPPLHPDDVTTVDGLRITTPARTLIDLAELVTAAELRGLFARTRELGLLDSAAMRAARARVEWRPSLNMLDKVIAEFCE